VILLEIRELMVFYENAIAINNVSLKCHKGIITGVFGTNSAGKSTLMYTISGIILDMKKKGRNAWWRADHFVGKHTLPKSRDY